ncbi:MAG: hypothetical protein MZW92_57160 [Comamonadaceae bacterium]|nr:hypothetical protein [Comamonadaceae bacterium]
MSAAPALPPRPSRRRPAPQPPRLRAPEGRAAPARARPRSSTTTRTSATTRCKVLPGEYFVHDEDILIMTTLGSCIAACLWDREQPHRRHEPLHAARRRPAQRRRQRRATAPTRWNC